VRLRPLDLWLAAAVLAAVSATALATARGHGVLATRLFVAALAIAAAGLALSRSARARAAEAALPLVVVPLGAWALVVSQTRSAWIGAAAGLAALVALALLRAPRLLWAAVAVGGALLLVSPGGIRSRLTVLDESSRDRYYMWQAGLDMVLDRPVFGQGPGMVEVVYERFKWPEAPNPRQPHLHNNDAGRRRARPPGCLLPVGRRGVRRAARRSARRQRPRPGASRGSRRSARSSWPGSSNTISATPRC
jgi:O-antigen ligase